MQKVESINAPAAVGPYSQAVKDGRRVFCSGMLPINPATGNIEAKDAAGQTRQIFANINEVLKASGLTLKNIIKTTVFLQHMSDFAAMNEVYAECLKNNPVLPARSAFEVVALPKGALVEIEAIASADKK